jgi:undecaprenyl phosphate N,N'-diacetylbacillosamine 1-phosphate transferase
MYNFFIKKWLEFFAALIGLIIISPILTIVTLLLAITNKGKPFFFQERTGLNEKPFKIIKFKTMTDGKDDNGDLLLDSERLTKVGSFVRKNSLDELPQLWCVLRGDMSLIGPRPLLPEYLPFYNDNQKRRHLVCPGITGWAQVNGRNAISWKEKFKYDIFYVDNVSLFFDLKIIMLTVKKVVFKDGISAIGHPTMPRFDERKKDNL